MSIPTKIYGFPSEAHRNLIGQQNPDYFSLEYALRSWNYTIKNTNYLQDVEAKEKQSKLA